MFSVVTSHYSLVNLIEVVEVAVVLLEGNPDPDFFFFFIFYLLPFWAADPKGTMSYRTEG